MRTAKIIAEIATIGTIIIATMAACEHSSKGDKPSTSFEDDTTFGVIDSSAYIKISDLKADKLVVTLVMGENYSEYYVENKCESIRLLPVFGPGEYEVKVYEDNLDNEVIAEYRFNSDKYDCWDLTKHLDNGVNVVYSDISYKLSEIYKSCSADSIIDTFDYINGYFHNFEYDYDVASMVIDGDVNRYYVHIEDVIDSKKGICVDLAVSMVATLRNHGHVARVVEGVLDNKDWHAWLEVRIGSEWRMYDPTLGLSWKDGMESRYVGIDYY